MAHFGAAVEKPTDLHNCCDVCAAESHCQSNSLNVDTSAHKSSEAGLPVERKKMQSKAPRMVLAQWDPYVCAAQAHSVL